MVDFVLVRNIYFNTYIDLAADCVGTYKYARIKSFKIAIAKFFTLKQSLES